MRDPLPTLRRSRGEWIGVGGRLSPHNLRIAKGWPMCFPHVFARRVHVPGCRRPWRGGLYGMAAMCANALVGRFLHNAHYVSEGPSAAWTNELSSGLIGLDGLRTGDQRRAPTATEPLTPLKGTPSAGAAPISYRYQSQIFLRRSLSAPQAGFFKATADLSEPAGNAHPRSDARRRRTWRRRSGWRPIPGCLSAPIKGITSTSS